MKKYCATSLLFVLLAACGSTEEAEREVLRENIGQATIHEKGKLGDLFPEEFAFEADTELSVRVTLSECSNARVIDSACSASLEGSTVSVNATATIGITPAKDGEITSTGCGRLEVICDLEALPTGDYKLDYGGESVDFSVPSSTKVIVGSF